ncbi:MAG: polysaccharide deacetylase family protein [Candidatus Omnitrophica bacterium]|nr:polysaccharide deacetylase family protein [Candidatus Omnitrophota bacterium]
MVILLYHNIVEQFSSKSIYSISKENFQQQMYYLKNNNYQVLPLGELVRRLNSSLDIPEKSVIITFDDGLSSQFEFAYPVLKKLAFPASFFVIAKKIGKDGYMDWRALKTLYQNGMEIGSHGLSHGLFDLTLKSIIFHELKESKDFLEKNLNIPVQFFSLPRGCLDANPIVDLCRKAGYRALCLSKVGYINSYSNPFSLNRFPIRRKDTLDNFVRILRNSPLQFFSYRAKEFFKDCLKKSLGLANYEYLRKEILKDEYINERLSPEE